VRLILFSLATPLLLSACTSTENLEDRPKGIERYAGDPRLGEEVDRICFASTIDGFSETTRDTVIVREGGDHYVIETFGSCTPLEDAMQLGFDKTGGCLGKGDAVIASTSLFPTPQLPPFASQKCLVKSMYKWDPDAIEETPEETSEDGEDS
tara:strand:- start:90 stop:545 length:456 start_codon:yes stop_codon:yes gene_type:complete